MAAGLNKRMARFELLTGGVAAGLCLRVGGSLKGAALLSSAVSNILPYPRLRWWVRSCPVFQKSFLFTRKDRGRTSAKYGSTSPAMEMRVSVSVRLGLDYTRLWETLCCLFVTVTILHTHGLGGGCALILLFKFFLFARRIRGRTSAC